MLMNRFSMVPESALDAENGDRPLRLYVILVCCCDSAVARI